MSPSISVWLFGILAALCVAPLTAQSPVALVPYRTIPWPTNPPIAWTAANVVGSAHEDILRSSSINLVIVDTHTSGPVNETTINLGAMIVSLTTGDLDLDGQIDIVCRTNNSQLKVLRNQGGGAFSIATYGTSSSQPVHLADLSGDGFLDILCGGHRFINNGAGAFPTSVVFTPGTSIAPIDVIPGDFDGDGDQDFISLYSGTIPAGSGLIARLFRRTAAGTWTQLTANLVDSSPSANPYVKDVDLDGKDDLVLSLADGPEYSGGDSRRRIRTLRGQSGPALVAYSELSVSFPSIGWPPILGDWNADGFIDIGFFSGAEQGDLVLSPEVGFAILVNDGTGAFLPSSGSGVSSGAPLTFTGFTYFAMRTDDDMDGVDDLLIARANQFSAYRSDPTAASPLALQITNPIASSIVARSSQSNIIFDFTLSVTTSNPPAPAAWHFVNIDFTDPFGIPRRITKLTSSEGKMVVRLPSGYASPTIPVVISTPEGVLGTYTVYTVAGIVATGGGGQSIFLGSPFLPLTGTVVGPGFVPIEGVRVTCQANGGGSGNFTFSDALTDANGNFSINAVGTSLGSGSFFFFIPESTASGSFTLTVGIDYTMTIVQSASQIACVGTPIMPIVGTITSASGNPLVGLPITITPIGQTGVGPVTFAATTVTTDAGGMFTFTGTANPIAASGSYDVKIQGTTIGATVAVESQIAPILTFASGQDQAIDLGSVLPAPIVVAVTDCNGLPLAGAVVNFAALTSGVTLPFSSSVTDSLGLVAIVPTFSRPDRHLIVVSSGGNSAQARTVVRGLSAANLSPTFKLLTYQHEHASVPLVLAVDVPPPGPFLSTPYGDIWTSILAPQPTLLVADGLGIFGPVDATMVTNSFGRWVKVVPVPVPLNMTFIAQIYGYDAQNAFPEDYIVSNPAYFNL